jgi:hypothetical protein
MPRALGLLLLLAIAGAALAEAPRFSLPLACTPGIDCWIPRHVDLDPGPGARDWACGRLTEDGHDGTDIAIRDLGLMVEGVEVLAVAPGVVTAVRDGMADVDVRTIGPDVVRGRECGNGVVVAHGEGFETQYCHLRQGSLRVRRGERVAEGQALGLVGMSGASSFPHVHLTIRKDGVARDPFQGVEGAPRCGAGEKPLWREGLVERMPYLPVMITDAGFSGAAPSRDDVEHGRLRGREQPADALALVFWMAAYGLQAGDRVVLRLQGPDGLVVAEDDRLWPRDQPRAFAYAGRRRSGEAWPPGIYRGMVEISRGDVRFRLEREAVVR